MAARCLLFELFQVVASVIRGEMSCLEAGGAGFGCKAMIDFAGIVCIGEGICRAYR